MILDFTISNFRSIKEPQTISFEATNDSHLEDYYIVKKDKYRILKIATILGANASGKSNVIRAFSMIHKLFLEPCKNKTSIIEYDKFALDSNVVDKDSVMIVNFLCGEQKYTYEVHFNNKSVTYELLKKHPFGELRAHTVYERVTDLDSDVSSIKWGGNYKSVSNSRDLGPNLLHNRTVFGAFQNTNVDIPWMKEIVDWIESYLLPPISPVNQGLFDYVANKISQRKIDKDSIAMQLKKADIGVNDFIIETETKAIPKDLVEMLMSDDDVPEEFKNKIKNDPTTEETTVRLIHNGLQGGVPFDFKDESGGTLRYFELSGILMMLVKESHFVAIDELECRLHPDLYEHFIATYLNNAKESQLVFTTHMREFLADRDMFRDDSVWFTEKTDDGSTELYSLNDFGSDVLRDSTSRYNVYRAGRLGAIPRLQDTYIETSNKCEDNG
jgi:AAA15 family ATPase/GTPase